jgi:hypothetical protein
MIWDTDPRSRNATSTMFLVTMALIPIEMIKVTKRGMNWTNLDFLHKLNLVGYPTSPLVTKSVI